MERWGDTEDRGLGVRIGDKDWNKGYKIMGRSSRA